MRRSLPNSSSTWTHELYLMNGTAKKARVRNVRRRRRGWAEGGVRLGWVMLLVAAAGCADEPKGQWENPSKPWEAWDVDRNECRELATQRAEQDYAAAQATQVTPTWSRTATFQQQMTQFDAQRQREDLFERCMKDRGYRLVPRAAPAQTAPAE